MNLFNHITTNLIFITKSVLYFLQLPDICQSFDVRERLIQLEKSIAFFLPRNLFNFNSFSLIEK